MRRVAAAALALSLVCAMGALVSGPGYRFGAWPLGTGFKVLQWSAYGAIAAALIALATAIVAGTRHARGALVQALVALAIAVSTFTGPAVMLVRARQLPLIHDISTDTDDPPRFVAVLPARTGAANSAEYGGPEVAAQQHRAYPDIEPVALDVPPEEAFRRALRAAREMRWTIVAAVPAEGRIEATATTTFFGFKDDVVVRVRPAANGSRLDVRSVSRIGESDVGTNARRIEAFVARVRNAG